MVNVFDVRCGPQAVQGRYQDLVGVNLFVLGIEGVLGQDLLDPLGKLLELANAGVSASVTDRSR